MSLTTIHTASTPGLYAPSLTSYQRRLSHVVNIGDVPLGGLNPIRVQSMTTIDTMDTAGSIDQCIRMIEAGCEYVRITAPSMKEAANLEHIRKGLRAAGYHTPLIADIHFTPNAAELAARLVEKVRINPGNYADRKRFEFIEYTDESYQAELARIRDRFIPLVQICKEYGTAMRIGTNHGSLSDRILSRYGDTPHGMVESAMEFLRICGEFNYHNIVLSMKSSNTQVMVQAYRLLVLRLQEENMPAYPLHLGVTEAGDGEDGRIKSAVGIGTLLEDGLGDTIRVSLTEEPEFEVPVAKSLADRYSHRAGHAPIAPIQLETYPINPFQYFRRETHEVYNIGTGNVPRVIADFSALTNPEMKDLANAGHHYLPALDKWKLSDTGADFIYAGSQPIDFMVANGSRQIVDAANWADLSNQETTYPLFSLAEFKQAKTKHTALNFLSVVDTEVDAELCYVLKEVSKVVLVITTENQHAMPALRRAAVTLLAAGVQTPIIWQRGFDQALTEEELTIYASTDIGGLLVDGLGDGIMLRVPSMADRAQQLAYLKQMNGLSFGILQASRTRMSKTEYISCPSCGRTLFDLQETTAMIRKRTDHLKGVKIGIMGCIVNGPGEMADADYGYVGVGKGKIALYRGQNVIKKSVPAENAVNELIELIREDGRWLEPELAQLEA